MKPNMKPKTEPVRKCDMCGKKLRTQSFPVVNENFVVQKGLAQCKSCYSGI